MLDFSIIGENIRTNRLRLNLTQEAVAEMLNVSTDYISKIETGSKHPSLSAIEKLADIFKVDVYALISDPSVDMFENVNMKLYDKMKDWEPETRRFISQASDAFNEADKAFREANNRKK